MVDDKQFLEDLMWTSYRYCIGRHTYVTMLAKDMGEYFYDKLSDERKQFIAEDIRSSIGDYLHYQPFNFTFDYTVPRNERKPMETFLDFVNNNEYEDGKWLSRISDICAYKKDGKIEYEVSHKDNPKYESNIYEHDLLDLIPWMDLASLFDVKNHKIVVTELNGELKENECYESYTNETIEEGTDENGFVIVTNKPWKYKKIFRPVEHGVSNRYVEPNYIVEIKDLKR